MTNHLIPDAELVAKLRANVQALRRTPKPLAEVIPLLVAAADALDRAAAQVGANGAEDLPVLYVRQMDLDHNRGTVIAAPTADEKWSVPLFLAAGAPAETPKPVVYWDKSVGGFYIAGSNIPENVKPRLTPLVELVNPDATILTSRQH